MIDKLIQYMQKELFESSHDIEHSFRVVNNARMLAKNRNDVDFDALDVACILHDIAKLREDQDITRKTDHCVEGAIIAESILQSFDYPQEKVEIVCQAIRYHREFVPEKKICIEAQILYDAGILENLGAIGIARTFMVAGEFQEKLYVDETLEQYIRHNVKMPQNKVIDYTIHAPNMEFELHWQDADQYLYTDEAKRVAFERISFSKMFFRQLKEELRK